MLGFVLLLLMMWGMKRPTHLKLVLLCAAFSYGDAFLMTFGGLPYSSLDALLYAVLVNGSIAFAIYYVVAGLLFRKKIARMEARQPASFNQMEKETDED